MLPCLLQSSMVMLPAGLVHCDFKPDNFLLTGSPDPCTALKVADFGHSAIVPLGASLQADVVGSVHYCAPEVQQGVYIYPSEVWSLGVTLYNMLFGLMPFFSGNAGKLLTLACTSYHFPKCCLPLTSVQYPFV